MRRVRLPSRGGVGAASVRDRAAGLLEGPADLAYDGGVVDIARGRDDQMGRVVVLLVEAADTVGAQRVDRVDRAENGTAEGAVAEHRLREQIVHAVARVVLRHRDLFEDDTALGVDVVLEDQRSGEHVADHVDGERQVGVEHARVVAGVLLRRERVHLTADRVDGR